MRHECWSCRDFWEHDDCDEGCVGLQFVPCPEHAGMGDDEPYFVNRRPLGAPTDGL